MGKRGPLVTKAKRTFGKDISVSGAYFPVERGMSENAKRIWRSVVRSMPEKYFSEADRPQLRGYCEASAMLEKASQELSEGGAVFHDHNGNPKESPWVGIYHKSLSAVNSSATKLRITRQSMISPKVAGRAAQDAVESLSIKNEFSDLLFDGETVN